jgi:predicted kinase
MHHMNDHCHPAWSDPIPGVATGCYSDLQVRGDSPSGGCIQCNSPGFGTLVVAVGPGGAGKSTYADDAFCTEAVIEEVVSLDSLRREIGGDAGDQSLTPAAVERQTVLLEKHLSDGTTVFLDSTNVEVHVRAALVEQARRHGRPIVALRFLPHLDTCRARNRERPANRQVPDDVLAWQHSLTHAATPQVLLAEGFTAAHDLATRL